MSTTVVQRKRVNFMIDINILEELEGLVPSGERSDLVNTLLEEKLTDLSREKASEILREFRERKNIKMSDYQILRFIHEARKDLL